MKKLRTVLVKVIAIGSLSLTFTQKVFADLIIPGSGWPDFPGDPGSSESGTFFDLIEPIHIIIGGIVLVIVVVSLFMIFKSKKK